MHLLYVLERLLKQHITLLMIDIASPITFINHNTQQDLQAGAYTSKVMGTREGNINQSS